MIFKLGLFYSFLVSAFLFSFALAQSKSDMPDIRDIPRLQAGLPPGTLAWATSEQLHPTQPQTGHREVARKAKMFEEMLRKGGDKFSKELFEFAYTHSVSPVFIAKTPSFDSRFGAEPVLGYITDRTHGSDAQSQMLRKIYGKKGLRIPILDKKGRPLNFILVKVMGDMSNMDFASFVKFMEDNKHCYLKNWKRGPHGSTVIEDIDFMELPELVTETTDNPYRGLIGELQHDKELGRSSSDFSQFIDAEALVDHHIVSWDEISETASKKAYRRALEKADEFFKSPAAMGLPGESPSLAADDSKMNSKDSAFVSCENALGR